jgi:hypothetical protein
MMVVAVSLLLFLSLFSLSVSLFHAYLKSMQSIHSLSRDAVVGLAGREGSLSRSSEYQPYSLKHQHYRLCTAIFARKRQIPGIRRKTSEMDRFLEEMFFPQDSNMPRRKIRFQFPDVSNPIPSASSSNKDNDDMDNCDISSENPTSENIPTPADDTPSIPIKRPLSPPIDIPIEDRVNYIMELLYKEREPLYVWCEKIRSVGGAGSNPSGSKSFQYSLDMNYDYLSTNALYTIDVPNLLQRKQKMKHIDKFIKQWWLAAKKWGLLVGEWKVIDEALSTYNIENYVERYYSNNNTVDDLIGNGNKYSRNRKYSAFNTNSEYEDDLDMQDANGKGTYRINADLQDKLKDYTSIPISSRNHTELKNIVIEMIEHELLSYLKSKPYQVSTACTSISSNSGINSIYNNFNNHYLDFNNISNIFINESLVLYSDQIIDSMSNSSSSSPIITSNTSILDNILLQLVHILSEDRTARVIVIGDAHGCMVEVIALLQQILYSPGDMVIFLGDLVAKGPYSTLLPQFCLDTQSLSVRGNHDQAVVYEGYIYAQKHRKLNKFTLNKYASGADIINKSEDEKEIDDEINPGSGSSNSSSNHLDISLRLSYDQYCFLNKLPFFIRSDDLATLCVHAGFDMNVDLQKQTSWSMLSMRYLKNGLKVQKVLAKLNNNTAGCRIIQNAVYQVLPKNNATINNHLINDGNVSFALTEPSMSKHLIYIRPRWAEHWLGPFTVYFGHDSAKGVKYYPRAVCLDSGKSSRT